MRSASSMSRTKNLTYDKSRKRYIFQIRVPLDLTTAFGGRTHIKAALGRIEGAAAVAKAQELSAHWTGKFESTRQQRTRPFQAIGNAKVTLTLDDALFRRAVATRRSITLRGLQQKLSALRQGADDAWDVAVAEAQDWLKNSRRRLARGALDDAKQALEDIAANYGVLLTRKECDFEAFADLINADTVTLASAWLSALNGECGLDALCPKPSDLLPLTRFFGTPAASLISAWQDRLKLVGKETRPKTVAKYASIIEDLAIVIGEAPVEALNESQVKALMALWQERGNGSSTIVAKLTTVITLVAPVSADAAACCRSILPRTRIDRAKRLPLTAAQLHKVREAIVADEVTTDDDTMLVDLMMLTGARLGEMMQMRVGDVIQHDGLWHLKIGGHADAVLKTVTSYRTVPLSTTQTPELERWLSLRTHTAAPSEFLFGDAQADGFGCFGGPESKRLNRVIRSLHDDKRIVLESIRNTVARTLRAEGVDPRVRRAILGHTDVDIHERHYDPEALMTIEDFMEAVPVLEALAAKARGKCRAAS